MYYLGIIIVGLSCILYPVSLLYGILQHSRKKPKFSTYEQVRQFARLAIPVAALVGLIGLGIIWLSAKFF